MFGTRACAAAMLDDVPSDGQDCPDEHNGARYIDAVENQHRCQDNKEGKETLTLPGPGCRDALALSAAQAGSRRCVGYAKRPQSRSPVPARAIVGYYRLQFRDSSETEEKARGRNRPARPAA